MIEFFFSERRIYFFQSFAKLLYTFDVINIGLILLVAIFSMLAFSPYILPFGFRFIILNSILK